MTTNSLKKKLTSGEMTYGIWNAIVNPYVAEICASIGYDWMVIDAEHAPFELSDVHKHLMASDPYETSAVIRTPDDSASFIKRVLDIGIQSVIVPMVESVDSAKKIVGSTRYAPQGFRGAAPAMSRASGFGDTSDYLQKANDEMCLILQIESKEGLDSIEAIAEVDGVDCLFIGPTDLATSMGYEGDFQHPEVEKVILQSLEIIRKKGKAAGILSLTKELTSKYTDHGANMIGIGVDLLLLKNSLKDNLSGIP